MADIVIRRMLEGDIDAVYALEIRCFSQPWQRLSFVNEITNNRAARYFVAVAEGIVVAYGGFWLVMDEGHITNIAVSPDYRRRGIGRQLVEHMMQYASNLAITWMTLEVRVSNVSAQLLYTQLGFEQIGRRPNYYIDEDAMLMACEELPEADEDFAGDEAIVFE